MKMQTDEVMFCEVQRHNYNCSV